MPGPRSTKRQRITDAQDARVNPVGSEASVPQPSAEGIAQCVKQLKKPAAIEVLTQAAQMHPDVWDLVKEAFRAELLGPKPKRAVDLNTAADKVWTKINVTHDKKSDGRQYSLAYSVHEFIVETIESIAEQCGPAASPDTRFHGLLVLYQIGIAIALSTDSVMAKQVRLSFQYNKSFEDGMCKIIQSMGEDEIRSIKTQLDPDKIYPKLQELQDEATGYCIFNDLKDVMRLFEDHGNSGSDNAEADQGVGTEN
jgi:signal recognition particle subunit SEC65